MLTNHLDRTLSQLVISFDAMILVVNCFASWRFSCLFVLFSEHQLSTSLVGEVLVSSCLHLLF